ncbi:glycosyltransferase family 4 protein [Cellulomonas soli]|uniref:D-inositol 3-phosphate glycosyltransferase n=1 Tax=Cellulomonas soli TaxID=931535 RepID=A0A512P7Z6_9CELL|nr:glycosyltransferase family 4 protein [Cellulomonas soli]NYI57539.1 glycosyltransferase involved in cell wall biosynthesis [Cellulomonas soli]GEP67316.1 glycosyl transferase family 1 [Cellulomonas soli]
MRVAVAFDCFYPLSTGGGERQYRLFAETFVSEGAEVDYLTRRQWTGPAPVLDGVDVVAVSGPSELYDATGGRTLLPAVRFAAGLFRHLVRTRGRYDALVVSALPVLNVFAARLALLGTRTRICADFLEVWRPEQWVEYSGPVVGRVASVLQGLAARVSPLVSCHSQMNARRLVAAGARRPPVVSPGLIHQVPDQDPGLEQVQPPTVVYVGRHIPDKRVEVLPAAVAWARDRIPGLRAVVLGEGQTTPEVAAEVARLGLEAVVELPGFVPQERLDALLRDAAVLVNPSRREGYGLVVVEACATGTPVVLVDGPDNASVELVEPGVNGFVARGVEPEVLGAAIVAAVEGGTGLRASTRSWFEQVAGERTVQVAATALLDRLREPGRAPGR